MSRTQARKAPEHSPPARREGFTSAMSPPRDALIPPEPGDQARAQFVATLVSMVTDVPSQTIIAEGRQSMDACRARQIAMYLTHVGFSWSMGRVGAAFGRDRTTASHACHRVEDLRDRPEFDAAMDLLEVCVRAAPRLSARLVERSR